MDGLNRTPLGAHDGKVFTAICRKTLGYRKTTDLLAVSQLCELTGLQRWHVWNSLNRLEARNLIQRSGGGRGRGRIAAITVNLDISAWLAKAPPAPREKAHHDVPFTLEEKAHHRVLEKAHH